MSTDQLSKMVGAPAKRKEDPRLIAGEGDFTDDVQLTGMVYMAVLRSPHAHARLLRVDASEAANQPEVLAVLTGDQVKQRCSSPLPVATVGTEGMKLKSRWPMATEAVNMVGEPVAAVVATSREAAHDALEMVDVEYELLPAVIDLEKALQEGSPLVHEDLGTNLCFETSGKGGDPDRAFNEADGVVSVRIEQPRVIPNPMEPRAVLASYERGTGNLTVWDTTQEPHDERGTLANILGLAENKVRVIAVDVGGGFGAKMTTYPESYIAAIFSMQLARPVKWAEDRQEHFMCTSHGRGQVQYAEAAYGNDGTLMGLRIRFYADLGAYIQRSSHISMSTLAPLGSAGMYRVKNMAWASYGVYTNKMPTGPYRGYSRNEATVTIERVMDGIAESWIWTP